MCKPRVTPLLLPSAYHHLPLLQPLPDVRRINFDQVTLHFRKKKVRSMSAET
jgi:hypothetical protein